jgi:signal transduction histidine kinase
LEVYVSIPNFETTPLWFSIAAHFLAIPIVWVALKIGWLWGMAAGVVAATAAMSLAASLPAAVQGAAFAEAAVFPFVGLATGLAAMQLERREFDRAKIQDGLDNAEHTSARNDAASPADLALGLAHVIRQSLASLRRLNVQLQEESLSDIAREECCRILDGECRRLERLLGGLLRFSHPPRVELIEARPEILASESLALMRYSQTQSGITKIGYSSDVESGLPPVWCDPKLIQQVLVNLMLNAAHATNPGGIVYLRMKRAHGGVRVEVVDHGHGIPPELVDKVFLPFVTKHPEGTGLGLAIVRDILARHNCQIEAIPNPERGMTFTFTLPFAGRRSE